MLFRSEKHVPVFFGHDQVWDTFWFLAIFGRFLAALGAQIWPTCSRKILAFWAQSITRIGPVAARLVARSEERRVGEECRSRLSPYH